MAVSNTSSQNQIESLHTHAYIHEHEHTKPSKRSMKRHGLLYPHHAHTYTLTQRLIEPISHCVSPVCPCVHVCVRTNRTASSRLTLARVHFEYKSSSMLFFPMDDFDRYMKPSNSHIYLLHIYIVYILLFIFVVVIFFSLHSIHPILILIHSVCAECVRLCVIMSVCFHSSGKRTQQFLLRISAKIFTPLLRLLFWDFQRNFDPIVFKVFLFCHKIDFFPEFIVIFLISM